MTVKQSELLAALEAARAALPQPLDPTCEITQQQAATALNMQSHKAIERLLIAQGWTCRQARLPSGKVGLAWRSPSAG